MMRDDERMLLVMKESQAGCFWLEMDIFGSD